jgi:hypothetical protein
MQLVRVLFILLISLIFISAHFDHPYLFGLWRGLHAVGLDISMTPITIDMSVFNSHLKPQEFYSRSFLIGYTDQKGQEHEIDFSDLKLHFHKLPLLLMLEQVQWQGNEREHLRVFCRNMNSSFEPMIRFKIFAKPDLEHPGFNSYFSCEEQF